MTLRSCEPPFYLPYPRRDGDGIYIPMPDGTQRRLTPLEASLMVSAWAKVLGGYYCDRETSGSD